MDEGSVTKAFKFVEADPADYEPILAIFRQFIIARPRPA